MQVSRYVSSWVTAVLIGSTLSACAYIIPPEQNEPRHNIVEGGIRKPMNNPTSDKRSDLNRNVSPMSAPVQPVQQSALPPADVATQQRAQEILAASPVLGSERRIPVQNAQFQVSSNSYPAINSVPEAPVTTGPDSAQSRLKATQAELEVDRSKAVVAADTLAKDAAAEPSMLSELPKIDSVVPPADPIQAAPIIEQAPKVDPQQQSVVVPVKPVAAPIVAAQSASSVREFSAPAPLLSRAPEPLSLSVSEPVTPVVAAPANTSVAPVEKVAAVAPTETATPVVDQPMIVSSPLPAPVVAAQAPAPRAGDFDPLAVADNAPISAPVSVSSRAPLSSAYVVNRYIPPSRYSGLRN